MIKKATHSPEVPTTERFIDIVIDRTECEKHLAGIKSEPCYILPISITKGADRSHNWGVCNWRARQAGFIGEAPALKKNTQWNRT